MEQTSGKDSTVVEQRTLDELLMSPEGFPPYPPHCPHPDQVAALQRDIDKQERAILRTVRVHASDALGIDSNRKPDDVYELLQAFHDSIVDQEREL